MIGLLHGYLLEGSGSNLWTRSIVIALVRSGETVHLFCQENHPEIYDFINEFRTYNQDGNVTVEFKRESPYKGDCIMHKPILGNMIPVYVRDKYEEFSEVHPMIELETSILEDYMEKNLRILRQVIPEEGIQVLHANHAVLMSVVARRLQKELNIPYVIMPHGSAIEYAVKKDERMYEWAHDAFINAQNIFVIGDEMVGRVKELFPKDDMVSKMIELNLGVDTELFNQVDLAGRRQKVDTVIEMVKGLEPGRVNSSLDLFNLELSQIDSQNQDDWVAVLRKLCDSYSHKKTDANLSEKLNTVNWEKDPIVLFVGRLINSKGAHAILGAFLSILKDFPSTRFVLIGHGPQRELIESILWAIRNKKYTEARLWAKWGGILEGNGEAPLDELIIYWDELDKQGVLDKWFEDVSKVLKESSVIFTGYLTHDKLCHLFPCSDISAFPSVVAEAGPLVFLEAMASGSFPLGTYFAGMGASIDRVEEFISKEAADKMKLRKEPEYLVEDLKSQLLKELYHRGKYRDSLRQLAVEKYDWVSVGMKLRNALLG